MHISQNSYVIKEILRNSIKDNVRTVNFKDESDAVG